MFRQISQWLAGFFKGMLAFVLYAAEEFSHYIKRLGWLDAVLITTCLAVLGMSVIESQQTGDFASIPIAKKMAVGWLQAVNIALGLSVLTNIRAISPMAKIAVAAVVMGLSLNLAKNALPDASPLTVAYLFYNVGFALWFINMHFRPSLLTRLESANERLAQIEAHAYEMAAIADAATRQLNDVRLKYQELEQHAEQLRIQLDEMTAKANGAGTSGTA